MPVDHPRKRKRRRVSKSKPPAWIARGAAMIFAIACNIGAPLISPSWAIPILAVSILLYLYSLASVEKWAKSHFKTNPISSGICILLLLCVIAVPSIEGYRAWLQQHPLSTMPLPDPPPPPPPPPDATNGDGPKTNPCPYGTIDIGTIDSVNTGVGVSLPNNFKPCFKAKEIKTNRGQKGLEVRDK
jgi:hypothetical protein